jgi:hypothetical protein
MINQIELRQVNAPDCSCINSGHLYPMINPSPVVMLTISCILLERKGIQITLKIYHSVMCMTCTAILNFAIA